jgi:hypothetical protein
VAILWRGHAKALKNKEEKKLPKLRAVGSIPITRSIIKSNA